MQRRSVLVVKLNQRPDSRKRRYVETIHEPRLPHHFVFKTSQKAMGVNEVFRSGDLPATRSQVHGYGKRDSPVNAYGIFMMLAEVFQCDVAPQAKPHQINLTVAFCSSMPHHQVKIICCPAVIESKGSIHFFAAPPVVPCEHVEPVQVECARHTQHVGTSRVALQTMAKDNKFVSALCRPVQVQKILIGSGDPVGLGDDRLDPSEQCRKDRLKVSVEQYVWTRVTQGAGTCGATSLR